MAIQVVCPGCHKRFAVSDQFAGRKGPCPGCKAEIQIPAADEQVVIHGAEAQGPRDSQGEMVLKPIEREDKQISPLVWTAIGGGIVLVLGLALMMRFSVEDKTQFPSVVLILGAIALGPPLAVAGYSFLRDDELEAHTGVELWVRAGICGLIYAVLWGVYAWLPGLLHLEDGLETYQLGALAAIVIGIGAAVPLVVFDFEYVMGLVHYGLYLLVSIGLCALMGYFGFMHPLPAS